MNTPKLFVWRGAGVLENWGTGIAFCCAVDVATARKLIHDKILLEDFNGQYPELLDEWDVERRTVAVAFLSREPEIFDAANPVAFTIRGSD